MAASSLKAPVRKVQTVPVAKTVTTAAGNFKAPTGVMNGPSAPKPIAAASSPKPVMAAPSPALTTTKIVIPLWAKIVGGTLALFGVGFGVYKYKKSH